MASRRHHLAQRRRAVGYTQEQLAEQLGVERTTVVRWEAGTTQPLPWQWPNLADALKITNEELVDLLEDRSAAPGSDGRSLLPLANGVPATRMPAVADSSQTETLSFDFARSATADGATSAFSGLNNLAALGSRIEEVDLMEMAQVITMWATRLNPTIGRRELLHRLSSAFAMAAVEPLFDIPDEDEQASVRAVLAEPSRFSEPALRYCEHALDNLRRQGDVLGPQARYYYDEARSVAHDAQDVELVTYVLCTMSHLATWQGKPRVGIDHAIAAQSWASQSGNPRAEAYAADVAARAFAADKQADRCHAALDAEQTALARPGDGQPGLPLWYFYDESFYWATKSECALQLRDAKAALDAVTTSLSLIDPANVHNYAFTTLIRAEALMQQSDIRQASGIIGDVATLTAVNTTRRIDQKIIDLRTALAPWQRTKAVRQLDDTLTAYRLTASGNGNT
jgi:DNA-binding XRE family transcriptional regulator